MVEDIHAKRAKELLHEAHYEELRGSRKSPHKLISLYEKAGDSFSKTKNLLQAENSYRDALKYARRYSQGDKIEDIEKKIDDVKLQNKKLLHGFEKMKSGLEKKFLGFSSMLALLFALVFVSSNLTGNAIGNIGIEDTKWIGACFFLCGLVLSFFYLKDKEKK